MPSAFDRRLFMRLAAGAAALWPAAASGRQAPTPERKVEPGSEELTHYQIGPHLWLRWHNEALLGYRAEALFLAKDHDVNLDAIQGSGSAGR